MNAWSQLLNAPTWDRVYGWTILFAAHWDDTTTRSWPGVSHVLAYNQGDSEGPSVWQVSESRSGQRARLAPDPAATVDWLVDRLGERLEQFGKPRNWWTCPLEVTPEPLTGALTPLRLLIEPGTVLAGDPREIHAQALAPDATPVLLDTMVSAHPAVSVRTLLRACAHPQVEASTLGVLAVHPNPMVRQAASDHLLVAVTG